MKTAFIDRDGVINDNRSDHVKSWDEFSFLPGALEGLALLSRAQFRVFVITNQAIINRGLVPQSTVETINDRMVAIAIEHGAHIEAVLYCPHRPDEACGCRKPRPGLLLQARDNYGVALDRSYLIGDHANDISAGQAVGCECCLVLTGRGQDTLRQNALRNHKPVMIAPDLRRAAEYLVAAQPQRHVNTHKRYTNGCLAPFDAA